MENQKKEIKKRDGWKNFTNDPNSPWMTIPETAAYMHMGVKATKNAVFDERLKSFKPGKIRLIKKMDADKFIQGRGVE